MKHRFNLGVLFVLILVVVGCSEKEAENIQFVVKNSLDIDRSFETVEIVLSEIDRDSTASNDSKKYVVLDADTKEELTSQLVDMDDDGTMDLLLFQPEIKANSERTFDIVMKESYAVSDSIPACYSRFVPERTDDYAWENNRVAFRTYGPVAQKMIEDSIPGGTLSSGIDAWPKRVDYPIINRWYKKELETEGSYHEDTGEGADNFHVGTSRGVGGIAVRVDSTYYISKNFTTWKTVTTGPIRTSFILEYANWDADGKTIMETKYISLDYGSNLSKFEVELDGTDTIAAGITLHKKDGSTTSNQEAGYISYWENLDDSEIGQGLVVPEGSLVGIDKYETDMVDLSNLYAHLKVKENRVIYYAGFSWKKSKQFETKDTWNSYLADFAKKINNPLEKSML